MTRSWIVSATVVAAIAGGILLVTHEPAPADTGSALERPPPPLADGDVRTYIRVQRAQLLLMQEAVMAMQQHGKEAGAAIMQARRPELLRRNKLDDSMWENIRLPVEHVVGIIRWEADAPKRLARIDAGIRKHQGLLDSARKEEQKKQHRATIAMLQKQRDAKARPINDSDRVLAKKFWRDLDRLVPRIKTPR